jgi:hypothetical protein
VTPSDTCADPGEPGRRGDGSPAVAAVDALIESLAQITDRNAFEAFVRECPIVLDPAAVAYAGELASLPALASLSHLRDLLEGAVDDLDAAWERFAGFQSRAEELGRLIEPVKLEIDDAEATQAFDRVVALTEDAIGLAREAGLSLMEYSLCNSRAAALLQRVSRNRREDQELAIVALQRAFELALDEQMTATVLTQLGGLFTERLQDDRADNLEQAIELLRAAVPLWEASGLPNEVARAQTTLAVALIRRERGERSANLTEAVAQCRAALQYRSVERNTVDWAFSQLTLADALAALARMPAATGDDRLAAEQAYGELLSHF